LFDVGAAWRIDPSAATFSALVERRDAARVEEQPAAYLIRYDSQLESGVVQATLKLDKNSLRAIEQRVVIRDGRGKIEYRFTETGFDRQPASKVPQSIFKPEGQPAITGRGAGDSKTGASPLPPRQVTERASVDLEIEAAYLLNAAGANTGEQI